MKPEQTASYLQAVLILCRFHIAIFTLLLSGKGFNVLGYLLPTMFTEHACPFCTCLKEPGVSGTRKTSPGSIRSREQI
ncbi:hypothetical protein DPMN_009042 [Dreissena polymorpha]|uniref:Uncharacterized protein n=1 Tax=Dreissena polymorpha TaxID=45954 RepID=A0A9D4N0F8_DREPO|nr:hypothetical protein DPMN_009042 [Dreissena polymorpha]